MKYENKTNSAVPLYNLRKVLVAATPLAATRV